MTNSQPSEGRGDEHTDRGTPSRYQRIRRCIRWSGERGGFRVFFEEAVNASAGLRLRRQTALQAIERCSRELGAWRWIASQADVEFANAPSIDALEKYLDRSVAQLARIASEPFTPKLLLQALPITNRERLRWMKDNRLPKYRSIVVRRGQAVAIPVYAAETVEHLLENPAIIDVWRNADRNQGQTV